MRLHREHSTPQTRSLFVACYNSARHDQGAWQDHRFALSEVIADLDGPAFRAYYCFYCAPKGVPVEGCQRAEDCSGCDKGQGPREPGQHDWGVRKEWGTE